MFSLFWAKILSYDVTLLSTNENLNKQLALEQAIMNVSVCHQGAISKYLLLYPFHSRFRSKLKRNERRRKRDSVYLIENEISKITYCLYKLYVVVHVKYITCNLYKQYVLHYHISS